GPDVQSRRKAARPVAVKEEPVPVARKVGAKFSRRGVDNRAEIAWRPPPLGLVVPPRHPDVISAKLARAVRCEVKTPPIFGKSRAPIIGIGIHNRTKISRGRPV